MGGYWLKSYSSTHEKGGGGVTSIIYISPQSIKFFFLENSAIRDGGIVTADIEKH